MTGGATIAGAAMAVIVVARMRPLAKARVQRRLPPSVPAQMRLPASTGLVARRWEALVGSGRLSTVALSGVLAALLEAVSRDLRAGGSLRGALASAAAVPGPGVGPQLLADDLRRVAAEVGRGATVEAALDGWARRRPSPPVRLTVGALALCAQAGGAQAQAIDGVAATLRDRAELEREARALSVQARASSVVIALAPVGFAVLAVLADPRASQFLFGTPIGLACLVLGVTLDALALAWMRRITGQQP